MKKFLLFVTCIIYASLAVLASEKWVKFEDRIYLDHNAVKKINDDSYFIRMKVLSTPSKTSEITNPAYTIIEEIIDCKNEMLTPESIALYDQTGTLLGKRTKEQIAQPAQKIQSDFIEARIKPEICEGKWEKEKKKK